ALAGDRADDRRGLGPVAVTHADAVGGVALLGAARGGAAGTIAPARALPVILALAVRALQRGAAELVLLLAARTGIAHAHRAEHGRQAAGVHPGGLQELVHQREVEVEASGL